MAMSISDICSRTDEILWEAYDKYKKPTGTSPKGTGCSLRFPSYAGNRDKASEQECPNSQADSGAGGRIRVSEQEARFAFVEALIEKGLSYQVEVPTLKKYRFTGGGRSAQTDLVVLRPHCNVEFKAKGCSSSRQNVMPISKDIQKLFYEKPRGLWFHLVENENIKTIANLIDTLKEAMEKVVADADQGALESPSLLVHICVLQTHRSLELQVKPSSTVLLPGPDHRRWKQHTR